MPYLGQNSIGDTFGFAVERFGHAGVWNLLAQKDRGYLLYMQRFLNLFMNRYKYSGLPTKSIDSTFRNNGFERWLFFTPAVSIFKDDALGVQMLPVSGWDSERNIAGFPKSWEVVAGNGYRRVCTDKDSVLMFNDDAYSVPFLHILYELEYMINIDRTHRQNINALRMPFVIELTEDDQKSAQKFVDEFDDYSDVIKIRKRAMDKAIRDRAPYNMQLFNSGAQMLGDELNKDFVSFENRILTYLGYNNVTLEKKERMLTGELSQNDQVVQSNYTNAYNCRNQAIERANEMFGTNMKVEPSEFFAPETTQVNTQAQNYKAGGDGNGQDVPADGVVQE